MGRPAQFPSGGHNSTSGSGREPSAKKAEGVDLLQIIGRDQGAAGGKLTSGEKKNKNGCVDPSVLEANKRGPAVGDHDWGEKSWTIQLKSATMGKLEPHPETDTGGSDKPRASRTPPEVNGTPEAGKTRSEATV